MQTKNNKTYVIYFDLVFDIESKHIDSVELEQKAYDEIWTMLAPYALSKKLDNEGHDTHGELICCFTIRASQLGALQRFIEDNRGGGDDIIYLVGGYSAQSFMLTDYSTMQRNLIFSDWDELLD